MVEYITKWLTGNIFLQQIQLTSRWVRVNVHSQDVPKQKLSLELQYDLYFPPIVNPRFSPYPSIKPPAKYSFLQYAPPLELALMALNRFL